MRPGRHRTVLPGGGRPGRVSLTNTPSPAADDPTLAAADPWVRLERWTGPWAPDDPDANIKADIALYARLDPLATVRGLAASLRLPEGALARYVLAKWATSGSGGLLEIGPAMVHQLWAPIAAAEENGTDAARLAAYGQVRQLVDWLRLPLTEPDIYPAES